MRFMGLPMLLLGILGTPGIVVVPGVRNSPAQSYPAAPDSQHFRYQRLLQPPAGSPSACAIIDAEIFNHAAPSLKDLRLYASHREVPYVITLSQPQQADTLRAGIMDLSTTADRLAFDLAMPPRPYTALVLDLDERNFLATASVSGSNSPGSSSSTSLGTFTLFDLSDQHLGRNTTLQLQEAQFPFLHVVLQFVSPSGASPLHVNPQRLHAVMVPPSREAQSLYTDAQQSSDLVQQGSRSIVTFHLPQRVPVERVAFVLDPAFHGNFSRTVQISDRPQGASASSPFEQANGTILRVHLERFGRTIDQQQLSIPDTVGSNLQSGATVKVAIENGDQPPLPITSTMLQMRQRKLCFPIVSTHPLTLYYGDPHLTAPRYNPASIAAATSSAATVPLGPEQLNPRYRPRTDTRSLTERQPDALWIALLAVIALVSILVFRALRKHHPNPSRR